MSVCFVNVCTLCVWSDKDLSKLLWSKIDTYVGYFFLVKWWSLKALVNVNKTSAGKIRESSKEKSIFFHGFLFYTLTCWVTRWVCLGNWLIPCSGLQRWGCWGTIASIGSQVFMVLMCTLRSPVENEHRHITHQFVHLSPYLHLFLLTPYCFSSLSRTHTEQFCEQRHRALLTSVLVDSQRLVTHNAE